jgi:hypothetical protein
MWDRLRLLWDLSGEVAALRREWTTVRAEWSDYLDISARREERQRKRDYRAARPEAAEPAPADILEGAGNTGKDDLRARARARGILTQVKNKGA